MLKMKITRLAKYMKQKGILEKKTMKKVLKR